MFVNRASFWTRFNLEATSALTSAAFSLAAPEAVRKGSVMAWRMGSPPRAEIRQRYADGSLDYLPYVDNPNHISMLTPFTSNIITNYRVEYDAELTRRARYPLLPSRLSAIFAFADMETCREVADRWGWEVSEVERFRLVPHELNRIHRANMEIVSLARHAYPRAGLSVETISAIWDSYWLQDDGFSLELPVDGKSHEWMHSGLAWEYLIEGLLEKY